MVENEALLEEENAAAGSKQGRFQAQAQGHPDLCVYRARWWLVVVFSALGVLQSAQWNFYSPISTSVKAIYGWTDGTVSWLANTAGIVFTVTVRLTSTPLLHCSALLTPTPTDSLWSGIMDTRGPRLVTLISCSCVLLAATLRCIPCDNKHHIYFCFASMVFNGLSAPPIGLAPPMISARFNLPPFYTSNSPPFYPHVPPVYPPFPPLLDGSPFRREAPLLPS